MKKIYLLIYLILSIGLATFSQTTDSLNSKLAGTWEVKSVKFSIPVDINRDGVKSENAVDEYSTCEKDVQIELAENMSATISTGSNTKDCKLKEEKYTWRVVKRMVRDSKYVNGKRIINERQVLVLVLRPTDPLDDSIQFLLVDVDRRSLTVKAELRDGSDSTSQAEVVYKKSRKK